MFLGGPQSNLFFTLVDDDSASRTLKIIGVPLIGARDLQRTPAALATGLAVSLSAARIIAVKFCWSVSMSFLNQSSLPYMR